MTDDTVGELSVNVPEMDCPSCAGKVDAALERVEGLAAYDLRPTTGTVVVEDPTGVDREALVGAVESAGYAVEGFDDEPVADGEVWERPRARKTAASAVFLLAGLALEWLVPAADVALVATGGFALSLGDALLLGAVAASGQVILRNGYYSARNLKLDVDLLMSLAIVAAVSVSPFVAGRNLFVEAASLAVLFNLAELLERYSIDRARGSLRELTELSPDTATVRRDGEAVTVPVEDVGVGEVVLVEPGEKLPVDGDVVDGDSAVDESPITGESVPVEKAAGDEVFAGTINQQGYLEVEATAEAEATTLSRIVDQVEDAEADRTEREQFVDRFASYYTPVVVAAAFLAATVPPLLLGAPWVPWFLNGIALLVIACPCAFVISTPVSVVSAVTSAARNGVLITGGDRLEAMGGVDAVAVDKTGTLTRGELRVTDVVPLAADGEADLLGRAAALERRSEHPIADAILAAADEAGADRLDVDAFESHTGKGVAATVGGQRHYAGTLAFFEEQGFDLEHVHARPAGGTIPDGGELVAPEDGDACEREDCLDLLASVLPDLAADGKTVVLVGTDDALLGVVAVADEVRPDAADAVARLHDLGVEQVVMLTGDNEGTAGAIAEQVGVDVSRAELLPEEKVAAVEALQDDYGTVAMVGDGINDAPALATADVGVAMGAAGTDTAIETADVALLGDDLAKLPYLYQLSNRAVSVIRQNVWGSLGVKALLALGIPLGYVSVVVAVLAGDVGMTVLVTGNAMRLSRVES
jgi:Cd2+/Zn2+-exporting ATPase